MLDANKTDPSKDIITSALQTTFMPLSNVIMCLSRIPIQAPNIPNCSNISYPKVSNFQPCYTCMMTTSVGLM